MTSPSFQGAGQSPYLAWNTRQVSAKRAWLEVDTFASLCRYRHRDGSEIVPGYLCLEIDDIGRRVFSTGGLRGHKSVAGVG